MGRTLLADEIEKRSEKNLPEPLLQPFYKESLKAASYDIRVGDTAIKSLAPQEQQGEKKKDKDAKDARKDDKKEEKKNKEKDPDEALFDQADKDKETKIDAKGREYRSCPQCGYNMYRQGRTWTCENCGYSYVE